MKFLTLHEQRQLFETRDMIKHRFSRSKVERINNTIKFLKKLHENKHLLKIDRETLYKTSKYE